MNATHIIAPFIDANGGDWSAIDTYLKSQDNSNVLLWSQQRPHTNFANYPIQLIQPYQGKMPSDGTLYISGSTSKIGHWFDQAKFERIILVHNLTNQEAFYRTMHRLNKGGKNEIEIEYPSELVKETIGLSGSINYPIPHPERYKPIKRTTPTNNHQFTVGRISKDSRGKHHFRDIDIYLQLAEMGIKVKIVGGTCLSPWLGNIENIELLSEIKNEQVPEMLASFDCFFYRGSSHIREAFGIVVAEAFLAGLPIVAHDTGGYSEWLKQKEKSFLFKTNQEALEQILKLAKGWDQQRSSRQLHN